LQVLVALAGAVQHSAVELHATPMPPHVPHAPLMQVIPEQHCALALQSTPVGAQLAHTPP
jgi:hypothetical protein